MVSIFPRSGPLKTNEALGVENATKLKRMRHTDRT